MVIVWIPRRRLRAGELLQNFTIEEILRRICLLSTIIYLKNNIMYSMVYLYAVTRRPCDIRRADTTACYALQHLCSSSGSRSQDSLLRSVCNSISRQPLLPQTPHPIRWLTSRDGDNRKWRLNQLPQRLIAYQFWPHSIAPGLTSGSPGFHGPGLRDGDLKITSWKDISFWKFDHSPWTTIITYLRLRKARTVK